MPNLQFNIVIVMKIIVINLFQIKHNLLLLLWLNLDHEIARNDPFRDLQGYARTPSGSLFKV